MGYFPQAGLNSFIWESSSKIPVTSPLRSPSMGHAFLLIFLEHFPQFWAKLAASPPSEPHQLHPKLQRGTGSAASNSPTPAPDVPSGFGPREGCTPALTMSWWGGKSKVYSSPSSWL